MFIRDLNSCKNKYAQKTVKRLTEKYKKQCYEAVKFDNGMADLMGKIMASVKLRKQER
jgi:hypothetical protein